MLSCSLRAAPGFGTLTDAMVVTAGPRPSPLPPAGIFDVFNGTSGNDDLTGTSGDDQFDMADGGKDTVAAKNGDDTFDFGAALTAQDTIDGGNGADTLLIEGNYASGLVFGATTLRNVEEITYFGGHNYFLTLDNANVLLGQTLLVAGTSLGAGDTLTFDGSAETSSALFVFGGFADDTIFTGGGNDIVNAGPGNDTVNAAGGDDLLAYDANFNAGDRANGGDGFDTLQLSGDYAAGVIFGANTMRDVERIRLATTNNYDLTLHNANVAIAATLTIDAGVLVLGNALTFNGSAIADGNLRVLGGNGEDDITIGQGGFDLVRAGGGNDTIRVDGNLTETTRINGGDATDVVILDGDYGLAFQSGTLRDVETLQLTAGHDYHLTLSDGNTATSASLTIDGAALGASDRMVIDASDEQAATIHIDGGSASDVIIGGASFDVIDAGNGANRIDLTMGGRDIVTAGSGADRIDFGATFDALDIVDTGAGFDTILLDGDYNMQQFLLPTVEMVRLAPGHSYSLSALGEEGQLMQIDGSHLGPGDFLGFSGGPGNFGVSGGGADDLLRGGAGSDHLFGNEGNDHLQGNGGGDDLDGDDGADRFVFLDAADSTGLGYDTAMFANFNEDDFLVPNDITGIDASVNTGALNNTSEPTFNTNLISALTGNLAPNHAIVFRPDSGNLGAIGREFLIIDINGVGGYQSNIDIVIDITFFTGSIGTSDFHGT
jgi:Ca2+-binding RTX toxin-like protein